MRISARILWTLTLLAALVGCKKGGESIRFSVDWIDWDAPCAAELPAGAELGIISGDPVSIPNVRATTSGMALIPELNFYWEAGQKVMTQFLAYYPYNPAFTGFPFTFSVQEDQRTEAAYAASDFVSGFSVNRNCNVVPFHLKHRLTRLILRVKGETTETGTARALSVLDVPLTGTMTQFADNFTELTNPGDVRALQQPDANGRKCYYALFMPDMLQLSFEVETSLDKYYTFTLPTGMKFLPCHTYVTEINLQEATAFIGDIAFSVKVTDWADGGHLPIQ